MKKVISIALVITILMAALLVLTGCEKGGTDTTTPTTTDTTTETTDTTDTTDTTESTSEGDPALVGSWSNHSYGSDYVYTFNADGTGKYDAAGTIMEFTYTVSGEKIAILYTGNTDPFETKYSINGDTLNVLDSMENDTLYTKVK